jgi:hypothetical protein
MRPLVFACGIGAGCNGEVTLDKGGDSSGEPVNCDGAETFVAGISATSPAGRTVAIASATPTPPDVGDNLWTLEVTDAGGTPAEGLAIVVTPWMPLHGHGLTNPSTFGAVETDAGVYELEPFDLIMAGLWQFTVELDATADAVVFDFCAEG